MSISYRLISKEDWESYKNNKYWEKSFEDKYIGSADLAHGWITSHLDPDEPKVWGSEYDSCD